MEELKQEGDNALREGRFEDAIRLYTKAVEVKPTPDLFTNRSLAHLKLERMYEAHQDAKEAIKMSPMWSKGYVTFGEVRYAIGQYAEAITSYQTAQLIHQRCHDGRLDPLLLFRLRQCHTHLLSQAKYERNVPWLCAGVGLIVAVVVIVADYLTSQPALSHVLVQSAFLVVVAGVGGGGGRLWMWYRRHLRDTRLLPPPQADEHGHPSPGGESEEAETPAPAPKPHPRYTKAQARQRFRKGKA